MESASTSISTLIVPTEQPVEYVSLHRRAIPEPIDYGTATYALSRHRKNKSKTLPGRVYEFVLATRFRIPGVYSWKCLHCSMLKQKLKKDTGELVDKKIPLLLVDNDIIKENPDRPNNGAHFCQGRDVVDATVLRTKLVFYDAFAKGNLSQKEQNEVVEQGATTIAPFDLTQTEKQIVKQHLNEKTVETINRGIRKRKAKQESRRLKAEQREMLDGTEIEELEELEECKQKQKRVRKGMVKLKKQPAKNREPRLELKKAVATNLEAQRVIVQNQEVEHIVTSRIPVWSAPPIPPDPLLANEVEEEDSLLPETAYTPLQICLDPEESDNLVETDEIIDVEGIDSS